MSGSDKLKNTRKKVNMDNTKNRAAIDVFTDVEESIINLEAMPDVIQCLIDALKLSEREATAEELFDLVRNRKTIYNVLMLTQNTIRQTIEAIYSITLTEKGSDATATETTK